MGTNWFYILQESLRFLIINETYWFFVRDHDLDDSEKAVSLLG